VKNLAFAAPALIADMALPSILAIVLHTPFDSTFLALL
jgi:hypothetical protein